jgi:hypothetical protein
MARIVHARIDEETAKMLKELQCRLGWSDSQVVREGIKVLNGLLGRGPAGRIIGLGRFRSGIPDLGSNKNHLKGFGRDTRAVGHRRNRGSA